MGLERLLIDTTILIDHIRKPEKKFTVFYQVNLRYECVISAITEFEFVVGSTPRNHEFVKSLLRYLTVLSFDSDCVRTASNIYHQLKISNQKISLPDLFIAATAITHNLHLLTLNRKHFDRVENLILYDPSGK